MLLLCYIALLLFVYTIPLIYGWNFLVYFGGFLYCNSVLSLSKIEFLRKMELLMKQQKLFFCAFNKILFEGKDKNKMWCDEEKTYFGNIISYIPTTTRPGAVKFSYFHLTTWHILWQSFVSELLFNISLQQRQKRFKYSPDSISLEVNQLISETYYNMHRVAIFSITESIAREWNILLHAK